MARVGLVNAVIRFDVNAGSDFVSFAVPTIMGEVRRHFRDNSWSVKVPRRLKELHLRLGAATAELSQRLYAVLSGEPVDLLETLAQRLADVCLAYDLVEAVEVTVHKPEADLGVPFDDVTVTIRRTRIR